MAAADVGDDVVGEDPTVALLERRVADMLGLEAGLFVPSGTMANQIALQLHARHGDEVLVADGAHCLWYESGAASAIAGVQLVSVGRAGVVTADEIRAAIRPTVDWCPATRALVLENTHNRAGGRVIGLDAMRSAVGAAHAAGLGVHLDGARLLNACVALGVSASEVVGEIDTVSMCLSKGLGAPVGSVLAGTAAHIVAARRLRKRLGGGMRQVGILAAAGLYALDHHLPRLADDHRAARAFAERLVGCPGLTPVLPETNIVLVDLPPHGPCDAAAFSEQARARGVLLSVFGEHRLRAVTHLGVSAGEVSAAAEIVRELAARLFA
ncbi:MAG: threonine aldolase [Myxococcaceae bacterium]|nr:threonine aldolase [Myxococcaceae bacterium]